MPKCKSYYENKRKEQAIANGTYSIWNEDKLDDLHFNWQDPLSYHKQWNFAIGERESGKSVNSWIHLYNAFYYRHRPSIVLRRRQADITSSYIDDTATLLNKFLKEEYQIQLLYLKGDVATGIADVRVGKAGEHYTYNQIKELPVFFRIIALGCPMNRIKSAVLMNVQYMFFDEFLANTVMKERYLGDEKFLIQEIYTTYNRESETPIRIICAGNPYSVYCPLFTGLDVDSRKLKPGSFVVGPNYVIDCFQCPEQLKEIILRNNPNYEFDDAYRRYAFGGESINDQNIRTYKREPKGFKLKFIFKIGNDYLSVHRGNYNDNEGPAKFWICSHKSDWLQKVSLKRRKLVVFRYADLIVGAVKASLEDRGTFLKLKEAMDRREVLYNNIDASYMLEDLVIYL